MTVLARTDAHEGPVYVAWEDALYFTTPRPDVAIRRLDVATRAVTTVRGCTGVANGMTLAPDGRLLVCEQDPARIVAVDPGTGDLEVVVDAYDGRPLNSPNDVAVAPDGGIWFTDPSYGHLQGFRPPPELEDAVYRFHHGRLAVAAAGFGKPNGLAFSPDARVLYVGDSERCIVEAFDVHNGSLSGRRLFTEIDAGFPDGLKVDRDGQVYVSFALGIQVLDASGRLLRELDLPGAVNFTFGRDGRELLVTTDDGVHAVPLHPEPRGSS